MNLVQKEKEVAFLIEIVKVHSSVVRRTVLGMINLTVVPRKVS